jgi:hypothetical protein
VLAAATDPELALAFDGPTLRKLEGRAQSGEGVSGTSSPSQERPTRSGSPISEQDLKKRMEKAVFASASPRAAQKVCVLLIGSSCSFQKADIKHASTGMVIAGKIHATIEEVFVA